MAETDRLVEKILVQHLLSSESTRLDFAFLDQGRAHARHIQSAVVEGNHAARAGVQSCGNDRVTETQLRDERPILTFQELHGRAPLRTARFARSPRLRWTIEQLERSPGIVDQDDFVLQEAVSNDGVQPASVLGGKRV